MRVLMLGWEYPPHISGGLGTACEGLSKALARHGAEIIFVVPSLYGDENADHMTLLDASGEYLAEAPRLVAHGDAGGSIRQKRKITRLDETLKTVKVQSFLKPYMTQPGFDEYIAALKHLARHDQASPAERAATADFLSSFINPQASKEHYGFDMFGEVARYAANLVALLGGEHFDVIHAHDWMTYPAGVALSQATGKPLVAHVHSLEFDRSGQHVNPQIHHLERFGLECANEVVAVSHYTKGVINREHGISHDKISVVHNGVYSREVVQEYRRKAGWPAKVVLFLGRITFQKGPDYFVEAAAKVIPHVPDVLFVMAGSGDMLPKMVSRVRELGIEDRFYFPGFLKGQDVEQMYSLADVYVMPSVSEPFGISALEAISFETPVIISRQSGVAEVLSHALKVDFWDVDRLADLIINALVHEELREDMVSMAREEVKRLRWDAASHKLIEIYHRLI